MADEVIEMNAAGVDFGDDPAFDNVDDSGFAEDGYDQGPVDDFIDTPVIEDEERKQLLRNLITKAKAGRLSKYLTSIDGSVSGLSQADLEARWSEIKATLMAQRGNALSTMGLTLLLNLIELAAKAFDAPGGSDNFALAALNDGEILDTWAEIELELMENKQMLMQLKPKPRFCLQLLMKYQSNRAKNLNLGGKPASESLSGRVANL
jgi:hypothetical protein